MESYIEIKTEEHQSFSFFYISYQVEFLLLIIQLVDCEWERESRNDVFTCRKKKKKEGEKEKETTQILSVA